MTVILCNEEWKLLVKTAKHSEKTCRAQHSSLYVKCQGHTSSFKVTKRLYAYICIRTVIFLCTDDFWSNLAQLFSTARRFVTPNPQISRPHLGFKRYLIQYSCQHLCQDIYFLMHSRNYNCYAQLFKTLSLVSFQHQ